MELPRRGPRRSVSAFVGGVALILALLPSGGSGAPRLPDEPRLAIVVDDFGYSYDGTVTGFLSIDAPLTLSVVPGTRYAGRIAEETIEAGKALIAHIPMEPIEYPAKNPGPGALMVADDEESLRRRLADVLDSFPFFEGANNHMGSRAMLDRRIVTVVLEEVSARDLYFIDSKTIASDLARDVADSLHVRFGENRLFWDTGYDDGEEILANLDRLGEIAMRTGAAIGIGHPRRIALEALRQKLPEFEKLGIRLVFARELVRGAE